MRFITRSKTPVRPASTISALQKTKAPVASAKPTPLVAASNAAPGVDQAVSTGCRYHSERATELSPMPRPKAQIQDVVCAASAPRA